MDTPSTTVLPTIDTSCSAYVIMTIIRTRICTKNGRKVGTIRSWRHFHWRLFLPSHLFCTIVLIELPSGCRVRQRSSVFFAGTRAKDSTGREYLLPLNKWFDQSVRSFALLLVDSTFTPRLHKVGFRVSVRCLFSSCPHNSNYYCTSSQVLTFQPKSCLAVVLLV